MSQWTHVAAIFRVDGIFGKPSIEDIKDVIGKKLPDYWGKYNEIYDRLNAAREEGSENVSFKDVVDTQEFQEFLKEYDAADNEMEEHPELYLPTGSEGCLDYDIWENEDKSCLARYTVSVFGDLRDYDDVDEIKGWFKRVCNSLMIRQAVCNIDVEYKATYNISCVDHKFAETMECDTYKEYSV